MYKAQDFGKALEKYIECLTASNFGQEKPARNTGTSLNVLCGTSSQSKLSCLPCNAISQDEEEEDLEHDNIDSVIMPVLCNMAACCIQLKAWSKAILFCNQALQLRPNCAKAWMRKGFLLS